MKFFLSFLLIFIILKNLSGVNEPKSPEEPKIEEVEKKSKEEKIIKEETSVQREITQNFYPFNVNVIFTDKTVLAGIISFPENSIKVVHRKKGFLFRKDLKWNEVKSLSIIEWKPFLQEEKTASTNLFIYFFYPYKWKFISKKDEIYEYTGRIAYLEKLILTNEDGSTDIYSFFVDYWKKTGENKGFWQNSKSSWFYYPFKNPLPKVFKNINFE